MRIGFYIGSILVANWLVIQFGVVHLGILHFPAGAICIGLTFSARDFVQRKHGKKITLIWMGVATLITLVFNWKIALASGIAFAASEIIDFLVYTYTKKTFRQRVIISNLIAIPLDSILFVSIAFGWFFPAIWGQTLIKFLSSLPPLVFKK